MMSGLQKPTFRFAPSPNGELHLGHAYSALINLKMARKTRGRILLRIENIDTQRCTPQLEKQMLDDLEWIGFEWDEKPLRQSERFETYRNTLDALWERGLIYPATLSRGEIRKRIAEMETHWPNDPDSAPLYPGSERNLSRDAQLEIIASSKPYSLRLDMDKAEQTLSEHIFWNEKGNQIQAHPTQWGDVVLARKDTPASYHLSCVLDDAYQEITHVVRGMDLYHATSVHVLLQSLLGLPSPHYHHHELIEDGNGNKLSKSNKDTSLKELREKGMSAEDVIALLNLPDQ